MILNIIAMSILIQWCKAIILSTDYCYAVSRYAESHYEVFRYAECHNNVIHYAECHMESVIMLNINIRSIIILNAVKLDVVAPYAWSRKLGCLLLHYSNPHLKAQLTFLTLKFSARYPYWKERISTVVLLALTSSVQLLLIMKNIIFLFYKTCYLNEDTNCTEPFPSVRVSWFHNGQTLADRIKPGSSFQL